MNSKTALRKIIRTMSRSSKEFKAASIELRRRGFGVYCDRPALNDHPLPKGCGKSSKFTRNYGMSRLQIKRLLGVNRDGVVGDLHRTNLLKHCIFITKQRKARERQK